MAADFGKRLDLKIKAGISIIQLISSEWMRIMDCSIIAARNHGRELFIWNNALGLRSYDHVRAEILHEDEQKREPVDVLSWFVKDSPAESVLLLEDLHLYFDSPVSREIIGHLRAFSQQSDDPELRRTLLLSQPVPLLPPELEKNVSIMEMSLPDRSLLLGIMDSVIKELELSEEQAPRPDRKAIAEAALGLTLSEAKFTFKEVALESHRISREEIPLILERKEQIIKKSGILEYMHPTVHLSDVGGMENLKLWLKHRKVGFGADAQEFGLRPPRGMLLLGPLGTGKGCIAQAVANEWNVPLLRMDLGEVFGDQPGEAQQNIRRAHRIAQAVASCILWVEEIEKGFSAITGPGESDPGIRSHACGTMVKWMLEKKDQVFIIATANSIEDLPPDMLRKGRFDEIFYVDLPGPQARKEIWRIHLKDRLKGRVEMKQFNFNSLASVSAGYTGAEIAEAINEGLYRAYSDKRELEMEDLLIASQTMYPLSKVMTKKIMKLRDWARVRTRLASLEQMEPISYEKKIIPILKQESSNPFIN